MKIKKLFIHFFNLQNNKYNFNPNVISISYNNSKINIFKLFFLIIQKNS